MLPSLSVWTLLFMVPSLSVLTLLFELTVSRADVPVKLCHTAVSYSGVVQRCHAGCRAAVSCSGVV